MQRLWFFFFQDNQQPVKIWEPKTGAVLTTLHAHKSTVMDIKWVISFQTTVFYSSLASEIAWHITGCGGGLENKVSLAILFWIFLKRQASSES